MRINILILAGGSGSRLWPLSRAMYPKQFLPLLNNRSMYELTLDRLKGLDIKNIITICNEDHRFYVAQQLKGSGIKGEIILEPEGRNTAPAIALAALTLDKVDEDLLLVLSADHFIGSNSDFQESISKAVPLAKSGKIVTFGIVPSSPHTGYGYIKAGKSTENGFYIDKFIEKPSKAKAEQYIKDPSYFWNCGMFLMKANVYLDELKLYREDIFDACSKSMEGFSKGPDFSRVDNQEFKECPSESIDYAVLEKTQNSVVVPMNTDWNDIGSWSSLSKLEKKDNQGNTLIGNVITEQVEDSYIRTDKTLVAAIGLSNLIVVLTKDSLLICNKDNDQEVKKIYELLQKENNKEWEFHREVQRPWGKFDSIDTGFNYQVKKITVNAGEKLSTQKHNHRSEHWIVVEGVASVLIGDRNFDLRQNESCFIPQGEIHALHNNQETPLEIIEIQTGSYLGEDDIIRFDDIYGRVIKDES